MSAKTSHEIPTNSPTGLDKDEDGAWYVITDEDGNVLAGGGVLSASEIERLAKATDDNLPSGFEADTAGANALHILDDRMADVAARSGDAVGNHSVDGALGAAINPSAVPVETAKSDDAKWLDAVGAVGDLAPYSAPADASRFINPEIAARHVAADTSAELGRNGPGLEP